MVLITGASGLSGQALVRKAVLEGRKTRILLRDKDSPGFEGLDVQRVQGNITEAESLVDAFTGVEMVIHSASMPSNLPGMFKDLYNVNVRGTENVIQACLRAGVQQLLFIANFQAVGPLRGSAEPLRESYGFDPRRALSDYGRTMAMACQMVEDAHSAKLATMILLPGYQMGPFDYKLSVLGRFMWNFARGRVKVLTGGGFELVDSRDLANATFLAVQKGRYGQSYFLSGHYLRVDEFVHWLEAMSGRDAPHLVLPHAVLFPVALFMEGQYRLHGEQPILNRSSLKILASELHIDASKAIGELGFKARSLEETFADTWHWMEEHYHLVKVKDKKASQVSG